MRGTTSLSDLKHELLTKPIDGMTMYCKFGAVIINVADTEERASS